MPSPTAYPTDDCHLCRGSRLVHPDESSRLVPCYGCQPLCCGCGDETAETGTHEVDGESYCDLCAAGLVRMAMAALGQLPHIRDTEPAPAMEEVS